MKKFTILLSFSAICFSLNLASDEQYTQSGDLPASAIRPCARCVEARENNLKHPNEYFYYEDFLESKKEKNESTPK